jgi:hypothetical protein
MSAHFQSSGPRSNAYSESKFTNWTVYDPFFAEARAALKRFDESIPEVPKFPHVIAIRPQIVDYFHACTRAEIIGRLKQMPPQLIEGLRVVFLLAGTRKQQTCWRGNLGCYGSYWRSCVFLNALPYNGRCNPDDWRKFYLDDVLVHEVAHHIDRDRDGNKKAKEGFAYAFVQKDMPKSRTKPKPWGSR